MEGWQKVARLVVVIPIIRVAGGIIHFLDKGVLFEPPATVHHSAAMCANAHAEQRVQMIVKRVAADSLLIAVADLGAIPKLERLPYIRGLQILISTLDAMLEEHGDHV